MTDTDMQFWSAERIFRWWVHERTEMYLKKTVMARPAPWTDDPYMRQFRFCNATRRLDKMTMVLNRHCALLPATRRLLTVVAYRCLNRLEVWDDLRPLIAAKALRLSSMERVLRNRFIEGKPVTSGVWMTAGVKGEACWESQFNAVVEAWGRAAEFVSGMSSLDAAFELFQTLPMVGPFVANEMVMDAYYEARLLGRAKDAGTWVRLGPGSVRGLRRLQGLPAGVGFSQPRPTQADWDCFHRLCGSVAARQPHPFFDMTIHDVEHSLCEYDKYCRARFDGGRLKNVYARGGQLELPV